MSSKQKITFLEHILYGIAVIFLLVPLFSYMYHEPAIDQLGEAFFVAPKLLAIPYLILFSLLFYFKKINIRNKFLIITRLTVIYTTCSVAPILLINMNYGPQTNYTIDGIVIDKKPGKGNDKAYLSVDTGTEIISFNLPKSEWRNIFYGEKVTIPVNKGCLGLLYKKSFRAPE